MFSVTAQQQNDGCKMPIDLLNVGNNRNIRMVALGIVCWWLVVKLFDYCSTPNRTSNMYGLYVGRRVELRIFS
jgi:hypothetical protein